MDTIDINKLSSDQRQLLLFQLQQEEADKHRAAREAYEALKSGFVQDIKTLVFELNGSVSQFHQHLISESEGFRQVMEEYGHVKQEQMSFTVIEGKFKIEAKTNKVKKFDERADMAAARLVVYLKNWVKTSEKGTEDPMYQLAMMAIERNQRGDLDYKQISNLYKLEGKFPGGEYTEIMNLFRESHVIETTVTNFYFYQRSELGVWKRIEVSFNRF